MTSINRLLDKKDPMTPSRDRLTSCPALTKVLPLLLATALIGGACGSSTSDATDTLAATETSAPTSTTAAPTSSTSASPTTTPVDDSSATSTGGSVTQTSVTDPVVGQVMTKLADAYAQTTGKWPGFEPTEHPNLIILRDQDDDITGVIAVNFSNPEGLGSSTPLDTDSTPFTTAHFVNNLKVDVLKKLMPIPNFEFHLTVADVDAFAINAIPGSDFLSPDNDEFYATVIHEMFHRYQDTWVQSTYPQDVDGYDYSPENITLAVLEERAMAAAHAATTDTDRLTASKHVAALRLARIAADGRIEHDESQERVEGTARYIEHLIATPSSKAFTKADNYGELVRTELETTGVKDWFGFGRFYSTGAAIMSLADQAGAEDMAKRIEAGESPSQLLIKAVGVSASDVDALVADARKAYDPDNELDAPAQQASEAAKTEGDIFGDEGGSGGGDGGEGGAPPEGGGTEITPEQAACLDDAGIGDNGVISDEVWEKCFADV